MKLLTKIYIGLTILLLADLILYLTAGITLATKLADQILFWTWFVLSFIVIFGQFRKKWARIYGLVLGITALLSLFPMGVPILSIYAFMIPNPQPEYLYQDNEIKVERSTKSVIGRTYIGVVKNYWIFEKEIAELDAEFEIGKIYYHIDDIKSITRMNKDNKNSIKLDFDFGTENVVKEIKTAHNKG
ncbi:hypothetical protein [Maribacter sp. 2210JD10-5]|uniref:hypothetical protein n=1 Tax=Maribacter sp. 2210JD10-5 TaxID=3386272 RepID=UPI0039BC4B48